MTRQAGRAGQTIIRMTGMAVSCDPTMLHHVLPLDYNYVNDISWRDHRFLSDSRYTLPVCVGQPARISSWYKPRQILPRAAESRQSNHQNPGAEFQLDIIKLWPRKLIQTNRNELMELNIIARQNI